MVRYSCRMRKGGEDMAVGFPLYIDLKDNNCTVFGGGMTAYRAAAALLRFHAKVTVISPTLCAPLAELDAAGHIRYLRRRYCRGDCSGARLCVAATDDRAVNIAISDECKNKSIPVSVEHPKGFGTFTFPHAVICRNTVVTVSGAASLARQEYVSQRLEKALPQWLEEYEKSKQK